MTINSLYNRFPPQSRMDYIYQSLFSSYLTLNKQKKSNGDLQIDKTEKKDFLQGIQKIQHRKMMTIKIMIILMMV